MSMAIIRLHSFFFHAMVSPPNRRHPMHRCSQHYPHIEPLPTRVRWRRLVLPVLWLVAALGLMVWAVRP